jgi:DNA-binding transcriptional regulator PaaX
MTLPNHNAEVRADVTDYLKRHPGQMICITDLSRLLGIGFSSVKAVLVDLHNSGQLRKSASGKSKYWMPTEDELAQERRINERTAPIFRPLKPRPQHAAVLERIAAERRKIASIG